MISNRLKSGFDLDLNKKDVFSIIYFFTFIIGMLTLVKTGGKNWYE